MGILYLSRHGESIYNIEDRIGGNSSLTSRGVAYAKKLGEYLEDTCVLNSECSTNIITSSLIRTNQTFSGLLEGVQSTSIKYTINIDSNLDEINAGICENMTYSEVKEVYPHIDIDRSKDKLRYRYPAGESYLDLVDRVGPSIEKICNLEGPTLVIAHKAILKIFLARFQNVEEDQIPHIDVPLHTLIKVTSNGGSSYEVEYINLDI